MPAKTTSRAPRLFPALLKHWRQLRGTTQLDLGLAADVSARHVSFLETGRAQPSREMVLRLSSALRVPLRDQNVLLQAAGFPEEYPEPAIDGELPPAVASAIDRMLEQQEPYPMVVMNRRYDLLESNRAAQVVLGQLVADPSALTGKLNLLRACFDPRLTRPFIEDWERGARVLLSRLHRESLERPGDSELAELVRAMCEYPDVPESWRQPDFSLPIEATFSLTFRRDELRLTFLTTLTVFSAPQNVTLDELKIESYFPADDHTANECRRLSGQ